MPGRSRPGRSHARGLGQHFLTSAALAARLAADAGIAPTDHVVEFGAGPGALTAALADCGARVLAIEIDESLAQRLAVRFAGRDTVTVFRCDALEYPLPASPYRVFANPPFSRTSAILHHLLDDPSGGLVRVDLIVQWQVARALEQAGDNGPIDLVGASWAPWWSFRRGRRIPAKLFRPAPSIDAAVLTITRLDPELLPVEHANDYMRFVRDNFSTTPRPMSCEAWVSQFTAANRQG